MAKVRSHSTLWRRLTWILPASLGQIRHWRYAWSGLVSFALFCFAQVWFVRFGLHWFGRGCSSPGRRVVVDLSPILFALVFSGLVPSALLETVIVLPRVGLV